MRARTEKIGGGERCYRAYTKPKGRGQICRATNWTPQGHMAQARGEQDELEELDARDDRQALPPRVYPPLPPTREAHVDLVQAPREH